MFRERTYGGRVRHDCSCQLAAMHVYTLANRAFSMCKEKAWWHADRFEYGNFALETFARIDAIG
jgi:hypothetical protein